MAAKSLCKIEGCDKLAYGKGLCSMHYQRSLRHGRPDAGRVPNGEAERYMHAHMWDECPRWPYSRDVNGYARIATKQPRRSWRVVSNLVCEMVHGPAPSAFHEAAHNCGMGNDGCFGARCVQWKSHAANVADSVAHGTWIHGEKVNFAKLTEDEAKGILSQKPAGRLWVAAKPVAERNGVTCETVVNIWKGKTWAHLHR